MSLYDNASLVMIPSGVKEDKLYSIKPTDGSGDFTFSRNADIEATRVNSSGLIEKAKENLLLQSNSFNTTWSTTRASFVSGQAGYDGTNDAWAMVDDTNNSTHLSVQSLSIGASVATFSIYAKKGDVDFLAVRFEGSAVDYAYFNLASGTLGTIDSDYIEARITSVGGGWYRCEATRVLAASGNQVVLLSAQTDNDPTYAGAGTTAIYIQDAMVNYGLVAQDYVETTTTAVVEGLTADLPRLDYSGGASCPSLLLEPSRTNLFTQSEYFNSSDWTKQDSTITDNAAISPEGVQNASLYTTTSDLYDFVRQTKAFSSGTTYTMSVFVKAGTSDEISLTFQSAAFGVAGASFNLTTLAITESGTTIGKIEDYGNGWYRCSATAQATATSNASVGFSSKESGAVTTLYLYGAQLEVGNYATSLIPTYGTSAVRGDDFMDIASLADEIDGNSFTYFLEVNNEAVARDSGTGNILMGATGNRFFLYNETALAQRLKLYIQDGTTETYQLSADNVKIAIRFQPNNVEVFENGVSVLSTTQDLDFSANSNYSLRGTTREIGVKQTLIFPTALTDAECISLTTI